MREMKDSGIEWIGQIPLDWKVDKIKYHLKRNEPKNPGNAIVLSVYRDYGVIPKDSRDDNHNVTSEDTSKYKYVKKGQLVINKMKAWQGSLAVSDYNGIVSPAYFIYDFTDEEYNHKYFHYLVRSCYKEEFKRISGGIREGQWDLSPEAFANTLVLLPPLVEQKYIADYLDTKCSEIDATAEDIQKEISLLEDYKKSVITEAVTKGLDPDAEMKDSGVAWIGEIPKDWKIIRFKYVAIVKSNLVAPFRYMDYPQIAPDIIEKDTGNIISHRSVKEASVDSWNHLFYKGQILYSKIRPVLNKVTIAPYDGLCSADMYPISAKENVRFLQYIMLSAFFIKQVDLLTRDRIKMPKINQDELGNILLVVPSKEEQQQIADFLDAKCSEIDAIIADKKRQRGILTEYKKSLIYEYVTGKKEVPVHE